MGEASTGDEQMRPGTSRWLVYHHDFLQIGGHSLLGLQVLVRVREIFAVELPLRALFQAPTLGELATAEEEM